MPSGQLVALLGPSGSGKSTILRIIAGLETAESGAVELTGEDATAVPIQQRGVGFVFQHYALFRHMTVRDNIAFGLKVRKLPRPEIRAGSMSCWTWCSSRGYASRYPSQLSGGQRQRVALARALAPRPKVLLLDEPFGALDAKVREELRTWLRRLHDEVHVTSLFVTHDQQEAFEVSDQVVVLNRGRIEQMGPPQELYEHPATPFVTRFLGNVNVLQRRRCGPRSGLGRRRTIVDLRAPARPRLDVRAERRPHLAVPGGAGDPAGRPLPPGCRAQRRDRRARRAQPRPLRRARAAQLASRCISRRAITRCFRSRRSPPELPIARGARGSGA